MFFIQSVVEEEQYVFVTNLTPDIPHHKFHLYPTAYFNNLLPFDIELVFEVCIYSIYKWTSYVCQW